MRTPALMSRCSVEGYLHVGAQESEEGSHSCDLNLAIISGVEVIPGLLEVFVKVIIGSFTFKSKMGLQDLVSSVESSDVIEVEVSCWGSILGGRLHSVVHNHRVHELVITRSRSIEVLWSDSVVGPVAFESILKWVVVRLLWVSGGG